MRKIKVVVLLVRKLQHGFTKNAKVSPNLTVTHIRLCVHALSLVSLCKGDAGYFSFHCAPTDVTDAPYL